MPISSFECHELSNNRNERLIGTGRPPYGDTDPRQALAHSSNVHSIAKCKTSCCNSRRHVHSLKDIESFLTQVSKKITPKSKNNDPAAHPTSLNGLYSTVFVFHLSRGYMHRHLFHQRKTHLRFP